MRALRTVIYAKVVRLESLKLLELQFVCGIKSILERFKMSTSLISNIMFQGNFG